MSLVLKDFQMKKLGLAGLVFIASMFIGSEVRADCCNSVCCNFCTASGDGSFACRLTSCANCSAPGAFSCCGVGSCNIFCCNCDGGCLGGNCQNCSCNGIANASDADLKEPSYWFKKIDVDANGSISLSEAVTWGQMAKVSADETERGFRKMDTSGNGGIDLRELKVAFRPPAPGGCTKDRKTDLEKKFAMLDRDHNGGLSLKEVELWAKENRPSLDSSGVKQGLEKADSNGDGIIQPEEFDRGLSNKDKKPSGK